MYQDQEGGVWEFRLEEIPHPVIAGVQVQQLRLYINQQPTRRSVTAVSRHMAELFLQKLERDEDLGKLRAGLLEDIEQSGIGECVYAPDVVSCACGRHASLLDSNLRVYPIPVFSTAAAMTVVHDWAARTIIFPEDLLQLTAKIKAAGLPNNITPADAAAAAWATVQVPHAPNWCRWCLPSTPASA